MRIKLATPLIGEFPRYANVKLPDNAAVIAQNMRLDSGVLKPLNGYTPIANTVIAFKNSFTATIRHNICSTRVRRI